MQLVRGSRRCRDVISALHNDSGNASESAGVRDQLTFGEPPAMEEVMVLNARKSKCEYRIAEFCDQAVILLQRDGGSLPAAPGHACRLVHGRIPVEQQLVVGRNGVPGKGTAAQRSQEHLVALRKQLSRTTVVVEVEFAPSE